MTNDTIVALLTPHSSAALAAFAVLGSRTREIVESLFERNSGGAVSVGRPNYGWFGANVRDDVVVAFDDETKESCIEISCHGGLAMANQLIDDVVDLGATIVDWRRLERRRGRSEFQCDTIEALARAPTWKTASILLDQLNGALDRAAIEAQSNPAVAFAALNWFEVGRLLNAPAKVVLFGLPNAGKSSLFNAIVGFSRVITNPVAGTTRDVVSETIALDGWPIELIDGAGIRGEASPLEAEGIRRLTALLETCTVSILVADATQDQAAALSLANRFAPNLIVANKFDLAGDRLLVDNAVRCSALTGQGVDELKKSVVERLAPKTPPIGAAVPFLESHRGFFAKLTRTEASASLR